MPITYRRPGVYLEESLLVNSADTASAATVAAFIGVAQKGPFNVPVRVDSWSDYVTIFGNFDAIQPPGTSPVPPKVQSYLPFSVFSYFQSGGRTAYIIRAVPTAQVDQGTAATIAVNGSDGAETPLSAFTITALSPGLWGNNIKYALATQSTVGTAPTANSVFVLQVLLTNANGVDEVVETFSGLSINGDIPGTRRVDSVVNDPQAGSQYITVSGVHSNQGVPVATTNPVSLAGGVEPKIPDAAALVAAASYVSAIEGPVTVNIAGYHSDITAIDTSNTATAYVSTTVPSTTWPDRSDIFVVNDSAPPRLPNQSSSAYKTTITTSLGANTGDSYVASYGPWIIIPHPAKIGSTITVPPGGAVMGVMSRIDNTIGVFRAPAGVIAGIQNAAGVQTKFTDTEQGDLNAANINVVKTMVGQGVCVMGARTRKTFGADRYVSARRTLIYIKEVVKRSTQFAVFENNDQRLWSALTMGADRILRPLWEAGGLKGANAAEAYFIRCDDTINTPAVVASGEVRMELGVALQYPAEFIIIRLTQYDQGAITAEVVPAS
jgi:uncharacterized protein